MSKFSFLKIKYSLPASLLSWLYSYDNYYDNFIFLFFIFSVCVQELMNVAYDTLTEATESSEQCAIQLFFAVRNMFELFCSVIPTFHRDSLLKFPQLSGTILF